MSGGALETHTTTCLPGWTPAPGGTSGSFGTDKCYRLFKAASSWTEAFRTCASAVGRRQAEYRGGALRGSLVNIQDLEENQWVSRMCKSDPLDRDCWIGLARGYPGAEGGKSLQWTGLDTGKSDSRYRLWVMRQPSDLNPSEV